MTIDEAKNIIKNIFPNTKNYFLNDFKKFFKQEKQLFDILNVQYQKQKKLYNYNFFKYVKSIVNQIQLNCCKVCNQKISFNNTIKNAKFCSNKCRLSKEGNPFALQKTKQKIKNTLLNRFGVDNPMKSKEILKKTQETNLKKYGNICSVQNKEIQRVIKENNLKKYGCQYIIQTDYVRKRVIQNLKISGKSKKSLKEKQVVQFCKQYFPNLIQNDRQLIFPKQLDIVIPQIKIAIQFNGIYWHSLEAGYQLGYHLMKTELCESKGYRLIHIFQYEWNNSQNEIKDKLISIFQNKEIIDYSKPLNRCWYQLKEINGYKINIIQPSIVKIKNYFSIENCGYLKYQKINK